jgi:hypothetical protein
MLEYTAEFQVLDHPCQEQEMSSHGPLYIKFILPYAVLFLTNNSLDPALVQGSKVAVHTRTLRGDEPVYRSKNRAFRW